MRTIQMAVAQKRLPLRCILCRAKVLKIKQNARSNQEALTANTAKDPARLLGDDQLPKSVSGYNINNNNNNISYSGSNYSFTSGWFRDDDVKFILYFLARSVRRVLGEQ